MKRIPRILVGSVAVAGLLSGAMQAMATSWTTHTSAKLGYSIQYPSTWKESKVAGQDITVEPADGNALLSASIGDGSLTRPQLQKLAADELKKLTIKVGTLKSTGYTIHGLSFEYVTANVQGSGARLQDTFVMTSRNGHFYIFNGAWVLGVSTTKSYQQQVTTGLNSVTITP